MKMMAAILMAVCFMSVASGAQAKPIKCLKTGGCKAKPIKCLRFGGCQVKPIKCLKTGGCEDQQILLSDSRA
jgi:hypothetical protein